MSDRPHFTIYTDGGSKPNPGPGGWGAILITDDGRTRALSGGEPHTTNNRMELTAAIEALRALEASSDVTLWTDSQYLKNGITSWLPAWIRNDWRRKGNLPVENEDLWRALDVARRRHTVEWKWTRGHAGNTYNERVDQLATRARQRVSGEQPTASARAARQETATPPRIEVVLRIAQPYGSKIGGWAAAIIDHESDTTTIHSGSAPAQSSNHLSLIAALEALRHLPDGLPARVTTPDSYLHTGITQWILGWRKRSWQTKDGGPVKYRTDWEALAAEADRRGVTWALESGDPPAVAAQLAELAQSAAKQ